MNNSYLRPAANHPAIQNLRKFYQEYSQNETNHTLSSFASKLGKTSNELGRYLRGECAPRRKMIELWAEAFGVDYDYMMNNEFQYIDYPFIRELTPKKGGSHIKVSEVKHSYDTIKVEINDIHFAHEADPNEYKRQVLEIVERNRLR